MGDNRVLDEALVLALHKLSRKGRRDRKVAGRMDKEVIEGGGKRITDDPNYKKEWYRKNKEKVALYNKKYYKEKVDDHDDVKKKKYEEYVLCECGKNYIKKSRKSRKSTKKKHGGSRHSKKRHSRKSRRSSRRHHRDRKH